jgi:hypothetical protein
VLEIAEPGAAPFLLDRDAVHAELAQLGQRSRGKTLLRSISSARGEMRSAANPRTLSRNMSAVSPRPKSKPRMSFTRMWADLAG